MAQPATCRDTQFAGLPATELRLPAGDVAVVAHHGAQVLSWVAAGRERLYLSPLLNPDRVLGGQAAIRGGIPVCFPQFNQRGRLPKHGFARQLAWAVQGLDVQDGRVQLSLGLRASEPTRQWWPQAFEARLTVVLTPGALQVELAVRNTDTQPLQFTGALHTYLAVNDVAQACLSGLAGQAEWDAVADRQGMAAGELRFAAEFDRVYAAPPGGCRLQDGPFGLEISQDMGWAQTVVWNPGAAKCAQLADMPHDGWRQMLCVEAAQVYQPITLAAGAGWQGAQRLRVL